MYFVICLSTVVWVCVFWNSICSSYMRHVLYVSSSRENIDLLLPDIWGTTNLKILETKFLESSSLTQCVNPGPRSAWELDLCYESSGQNIFFLTLNWRLKQQFSLLSSFVHLVFLGHSLSNNVVLKSSSVMRRKMVGGMGQFNFTLHWPKALCTIPSAVTTDQKTPSGNLPASELSQPPRFVFLLFHLKKNLLKYSWFTVLC